MGKEKERDREGCKRLCRLKKMCVGQSKWPSSKSLQKINAGEGVEKREPCYTVGGNVNWCTHYGKQYGGSLEN